MEDPAFPLTTSALSMIAGNISFYPSSLVLTAFVSKAMSDQDLGYVYTDGFRQS